MNEELQNFSKEMVNKWGEINQLRQTQEEAAELITAISHFLREKEGAKENLYEEIADMIIMINQLFYILGEDNIQDWVSKKIARGGGWTSLTKGDAPCH